MSATPEQIADLCERLDEPSNWMKEGRANKDWNTLRGTYDKAPFEAATLIRAQSEREKVLVEALRGLLRTHDDPADPESAVAMEREIRLVEQARAALKAAP